MCGAWHVVRGVWCVARGVWCVVCGAQRAVCVVRGVGVGAVGVVGACTHGPCVWCVHACDVRVRVVCGVWRTVRGVRCVARDPQW